MIRAALSAAALLLAGCVDRSENEVVIVDLEGDPGDELPAAPLRQADAPHLILYKSANEGGPEAFMEALIGGTLDLSGPCVAVRSGEEPHVVITTAGRIEVDEEGLLLRVGPHVFRDGDAIISGGGFMGDALQNEAFLTEPIPTACAEAPKVQLSAITPMPPEGFSEPPVNPPPPPSPSPEPTGS